MKEEHVPDSSLQGWVGECRALGIRVEGKDLIALRKAATKAVDAAVEEGKASGKKDYRFMVTQGGARRAGLLISPSVGLRDFRQRKGLPAIRTLKS